MKVSALMTTFNQERFVAEAIEGFLMQQTDFPCELVIADDASTDSTRAVIRRYWERDRDRIRVMLNRCNIGGRRTMMRAYMACRGQYVASLDGDDCWTSRHKLQQQVDLMERHPEYAMCFHSVHMVWDDGSREPVVYRPGRIRDRYTLEDLLEYNFIASCSPMYRRGVFARYPAWCFLMPIGDWTQHVLHAQHGAIGYIDEPMGIYRQHGGGIYSTSSAAHRLRIAIQMLRHFECVVPASCRPVINRSLYRHYCQLVGQYCDEGRLDDARCCMKECLRHVHLNRQIPVWSLLNLILRVSVPRLHGRFRWILGLTGIKGVRRSTC